MRVLFLTKQQYMGKDLLQDRFGRFYELPKILASQGHGVRGICLKYWNNGIDPSVFRQNLDGVEWESIQLGWNWPAALCRYFWRLKEVARDFEPEIIVGASDAMHVIMAASLSSKIEVPLVVDLYDDFESYGATQLPGIKTRLKRGILSASAVSTVSSALAEKVTNEYRASGIVRTITNAVCPEVFHPSDKLVARRKLCLPEGGLLMGTGGALSSLRGIETLFQAFEKLSDMRSELYLVLAGRVGRGLHIPISDRIRYLGELPHSHIGHLFNALDVGVVCNRQNPFAEYGFPQKFYEMIACGLPVVAANVGVMQKLLVGYEDALYEPDQAASLVNAVEKQLNKPNVTKIPVPTWKERGADFHQLLEAALKRSDRINQSASSNRFVIDF